MTDSAMTDTPLPGPDWLAANSGTLVLWCEPDELLSEGREEKFMAWLNDEERARHTRFMFPHSKREFLSGRALIRGVLGSILSRAPESLDFIFNADGKPALKGIDTPLKFNLTHTRGLVALALHSSLQIGVDAEVIDTERADPNLAKRFFSVHETRHLWKFEDSAYAAEFYRIWTMKEAYIKARGTGMRTPLDQFFILPIESDGRYAINFEPDVEDDPAVWQIESAQLTPNHFLSVAIKKQHVDTVALTLRKVVSL